MITLLGGLLAAYFIWWLLKAFSRAKPAVVARVVKQVGGILALALAALLGARGRLDMALLLSVVGCWLLGWSGLVASLKGPRKPKRAGAVSRVRSAMIEMELDHDSGRMRGTVLAGHFAGQSLDDLSPEVLREVRTACLRHDPDGVRLIEAYFDRRLPGWREHAEADGDPRRRPDPKSGPMTKEEAYEILGLEPGAEADAIRRAHRGLIKKLHPDQGGSTYLAGRVNQAKDVLLNRHR